MRAWTCGWMKASLLRSVWVWNWTCRKIDAFRCSIWARNPTGRRSSLYAIQHRRKFWCSMRDWTCGWVKATLLCSMCVWNWTFRKTDAFRYSIWGYSSTGRRSSFHLIHQKMAWCFLFPPWLWWGLCLWYCATVATSTSVLAVADFVSDVKIVSVEIFSITMLCPVFDVFYCPFSCWTSFGFLSKPPISGGCGENGLTTNPLRLHGAA